MGDQAATQIDGVGLGQVEGVVDEVEAVRPKVGDEAQVVKHPRHRPQPEGAAGAAGA